MTTIKKTILTVIFLLCTYNVNAQTTEERLNALETWRVQVDSALGFSNPIEPIDTLLSKPINEGIVTRSASYDYFIYNPAIIINGVWNVYTVKDGAIWLGKSSNGMNGFEWTLTNAPYGSIVYRTDLNIFYGSWHKWHTSVQGRCTNYFSGSLDGNQWNTMSADWTQTSGEDRNMIYDNGMYKNYIRVNPTPRTIGYTESSNGYSWSAITEILKPDAVDIAGLEFYEMSVIKTLRGYFGLLNTYNRNTSIVELQLAYSENGKTNWRRLNNKNIFITRPAGIKQMFGNWSVINDMVYIYTIENYNDHESGGLHFSSRYKISLNELYKYLN